MTFIGKQAQKLTRQSMKNTRNHKETNTDTQEKKYEMQFDQNL